MPPKIDERRYEDIIDAIKSHIPWYCPEWQPFKNTAGYGVLSAFASLLETVLERLNRVPDKYLIAYLDKLGLKQLPARSATAPVTFQLTRGTPEHVLIPAHTQVAAGDIVFETEKNILATPARLNRVYSLDPFDDQIVESPPHVISGDPFIPLQSKLTFQTVKGDRDIFLDQVESLASGEVITIGELHSENFEFALVSEITDTKIILQQLLENAHATGEPVRKQEAFEPFEGKNLQEHVLYLAHSEIFYLSGSATITLFTSPVADALKHVDKITWQYWGEHKETKKADWYNFTILPDSGVEASKFQLEKEDLTEITEFEINGVKNRWIRAKVNPGKISHFVDSLLNTIKVSAAPAANVNLKADMLFSNDVPLPADPDLKKPIYPFGKVPRLNDTFYIASREAFSKKGAALTMTIDGYLEGKPKIKQLSINPLLSWEYWDGNGWIRLPEIEENFMFEQEKTISVPISELPEIKTLKVNGQENFWIRVRLVAGDYGKEIKIKGSTVVEGLVTPPVLTGLTLQYDYDENYQEVEKAYTFNNLGFIDVTDNCRNQGKDFKPFVGLKDGNQSIYLGFDKKPEKGPVSLYFLIEEQPWLVEKPLRLEWQYYNENREWKKLQQQDNTRGFTRNGSIEFNFPLDFSKSIKLGQDLYWIRAVDSENRLIPSRIVYQPLLGTKAGGDYRGILAKKIREADLPKTSVYRSRKEFFLSGHFRERLRQLIEKEVQKKMPLERAREKCAGLLQAFHPAWHTPAILRSEYLSPKIKGIFINTTQAVHVKTIRDENMGSSSGSASQIFQVRNSPVISQEIYINEVNQVSEDELKQLKASGIFEVNEIKDEQGKLTELWIKWEAVEDLLGSSNSDRHYEINPVSGEIKFGDGIYGKIPPLGKDNIKVTYQIGGGSQGNLAALEIKDLKSSLAFVDKTFNPLAAHGGADIESMSEVSGRGAHVLRHRNRAVTIEDFERLAKDGSRAIARVRCLPNFNDQGEFQTGWVTILVIPESTEDKPALSLQLKQQIENYLDQRVAFNLVEKNHLQVSQAVYVEVGIEAILKSESIENIPVIESLSLTRLGEYLHPLSGGDEGKGWEFGQLPCISDFYQLLESIEGTDHVVSLTMVLKSGFQSELKITPSTRLDNGLLPYAIICNGEHQITVE